MDLLAIVLWECKGKKRKEGLQFLVKHWDLCVNESLCLPDPGVLSSPSLYLLLLLVGHFQEWTFLLEKIIISVSFLFISHYFIDIQHCWRVSVLIWRFFFSFQILYI